MPLSLEKLDYGFWNILKNEAALYICCRLIIWFKKKPVALYKWHQTGIAWILLTSKCGSSSIKALTQSELPVTWKLGRVFLTLLLAYAKNLGVVLFIFYGEKLLKAKVRIFSVFYNLKKNILNFNVNRKIKFGFYLEEHLSF